MSNEESRLKGEPSRRGGGLCGFARQPLRKSLLRLAGRTLPLEKVGTQDSICNHVPRSDAGACGASSAVPSCWEVAQHGRDVLAALPQAHDYVIL